ncbi:MAG: 1,2-phenylacetyl-CoA epoxidase subunit PaaD [Balneolaceae bacterium]|nr:1,2-phenylacetyl-CoA epoxidase subunit PaaD [Balneolaceae bacterium]
MTTTATYSEEQIWDWLKEITDPEIPVLNIVEMGIARSVEIDEEDRVLVKITPTYSGCPAMTAIENEIRDKLERKGIDAFQVKKDFSETWTTDWMTEEARKKLKEYGIAPPGETSDDDVLKSLKNTRIIPCPYCDSTNTELQSEFGSTACKAQYYCHDCEEPFEHFKCI